MVKNINYGSKCTILCGLLALVILLSSVEGSAASVKVSIPEKDEPWPWKPQLDAVIPHHFFTGEVVLSDADQWRVLSYVGAPFRIRSDNSFDLMQIVELVHFMRADGKGQCPAYTTPHRIFYFWFHPEELEELYGEARWAALQQLQEPKAWSLLLLDSVGPAVREAEAFLSRLEAVDPPGQLTLRIQNAPAAAQEVRVSLADFRVNARVIMAGHAMQMRLPQLTVESGASGRRHHLYRFLQVKKEISARVEAFDAAIVQVQRNLHDSLLELRQAEQAAYDAQARLKQRYQRFLLERQSRRTAEKAQSGNGGDDGVASPTDLDYSPSALRSALKVRTVVPQARTAAEGHVVACRTIYAAWHTLQQNGVRWEADERAVQLRRLHARHACADDLASLQGIFNMEKDSEDVDDNGAESSKTAEELLVELSPAAQELWVMSVAEMLAQWEKSGRPPTFAQLFAVLFAIWKAEKESTSAAEGNVSSSEYDAAAFVSFVDRLVESGDAVAMAGGWLPRFVRAELQYVVGILDLVTHYHYQSRSENAGADSISTFPRNDTEARKQIHKLTKRSRTLAGGVVRGVLHLHESLSTGSHHAAGALATLREHGIFVRQHAKAAMLLLLRSMTHAPSHLLRELLLAPRSEGDVLGPPLASRASQKLQTSGSKLDASRLLRFEQFYAVDNTFHQVDDPFLTRDVVKTIVAVSSENIQSNDDAPEMEDAYREAEEERGNENYEGSISTRLSRRVTKANMLFTGFKDTPRNPQEAQCELLVVLRKLGYFCDLNPQWVLSVARSSRSGRGRRSAPETLIGVPLPESCAEHDTEIYSVLSNNRHTMLTCPNRTTERTMVGSEDAAALLGHPFLEVPNSEALFALLHQVLLSLSYVHMIHTQQYELSHLYATLSVEMSLRLQRLLVTRVSSMCKKSQLFLGALVRLHPKSTSNGNRVRMQVPLHSVLQVFAEGSDSAAWAAEVLLDKIEDESESENASAKNASTALRNARASRALLRCHSVADSPFVVTEALLLLALSQWARRGPLVGNLMEPRDVEKRLRQWAIEPFQLLGQLLSADTSDSATNTMTAGAHVATGQSAREASDDVELKKLKPVEGEDKSDSPLSNKFQRRGDTRRPREPLDVHALFLICLAAMKRVKSDLGSVHLLDSTSSSVHRTDPFVLASFLLRARDPTDNAAPLISLPKLRNIAFAASPHFLGQTLHFLPLVDDTVESYAARLLRFSARHTDVLAATAELLQSGAYGIELPTSRVTVSSSFSPSPLTAATVGLRRQGVVDDAPPRSHRLRTLRRVKQETFETADLQPLLYAADAHDYHNTSRWTYFGTALNAAYNVLLYPFTYTTSESVLMEMEARLQFIAPEERQNVLRTHMFYHGDEPAAPAASDSEPVSGAAASAKDTKAKQLFPHREAIQTGAEEETTSVGPFIDAFSKDVQLREHFLACQLFSFTLESGMPEGFSLIFYEAADRGNPFLATLADLFADAVFGRWTATVWTEHHLSAQWQREKRELPLDGSILTLNARSPFRYASLEGRQELFARMSRWKAAKAASRSGTPSSSAAALNELLWCSGLLTRKAYYATGQIYPMAYEGSVYPAADLECLAEFNALVTSGADAAASQSFTARGGGMKQQRGSARSKVRWRQAQQNGTLLLRDLADRLAYDYDLIESPPPRRLPLSEREFRRNTSDLEAALKLAEEQHVYKKHFRRASTQLVEPWNRRSYAYDEKTLSYGEGMYYNSRLHRVSGYRWGSLLQSWWLWLRYFFP